jgi:hypothetical protein
MIHYGNSGSMISHLLGSPLQLLPFNIISHSRQQFVGLLRGAILEVRLIYSSP